ncbi:MAG TPA: hypothetical protein PKC40_13020 [Saprospiraceae bacterium]|nr:hypothetical protein [Saprospiraceae bacterium]
MSTKSHKQRRLEIKDRRDSKKFFTVLGVALLILLVIVFLIYLQMA